MRGRKPASPRNGKRNVTPILPAAARRPRLWGLPTIVLLVLAACGCGRRAPTYAPGDLTVTSTPPGATILLDGRDTGEVTPHTFAGLGAAVYTVAVRREGWVADPPVDTVDLQPLEQHNSDFDLFQTGVTVTSTPAGARILVDGTDSGLVTPATVSVAEPGDVDIALELDGYVTFPAAHTAVVAAGQVTTLLDSTFVLRPRRTVILEGFANVDCGPCPQLTANLLALTGQPGYGPDRVLFVEFSVSWPSFQDPFYLANAAENTDRYTYYQVQAAPTLVADGDVLSDAVSPEVARAAVDADLPADPGVLVDVAADPAQATVPVTVTLVPLRDLDLTGQVLFVALYETEVTVIPAPGSNQQTEFHHVFRDRVDTPPALGALTAGVPQEIAVTLQRGDRDPGNVVVVAWVQDPATHAVLQAGSTAATSRVPAALASPEGSRP